MNIKIFLSPSILIHFAYYWGGNSVPIPNTSNESPSLFHNRRMLVEALFNEIVHCKQDKPIQVYSSTYVLRSAYNNLINSYYMPHEEAEQVLKHVQLVCKSTGGSILPIGVESIGKLQSDISRLELAKFIQCAKNSEAEIYVTDDKSRYGVEKLDGLAFLSIPEFLNLLAGIHINI